MSLYIKRLSSSLFYPAFLGGFRWIRPFLELFRFSLLPLRKYIFFLISLFLAVAMLYVSKTSLPVLVPIQNLFLEANGKIRLSCSGFMEGLTVLKRMVFEYHQTFETKRNLELENAELHRKLTSLVAIQQENDALRQATKLVTECPGVMITAPVISSPLKGWNHCFLIAAGQMSGIQEGQPVLSPHGVVGQIERVSGHVARVMPLTHQDSRIPVKGLSNRVEAILAGDGSPTPFLVYMQEDHVPEVGEIWVTSRHGGRFPPGHRVGYLGQQQDGKRLVHTYIPWHDLAFVQVITDLPVETKTPSSTCDQPS